MPAWLRLGRTKRQTAVCAVLFVLSSCSRNARELPESSCDKTPIVNAEIEAVSENASLYGLVFRSNKNPIRSGDEVKIVWRMTGEGDLQVTSHKPDGSRGELTFGPEPHWSSSYQRPGDEWGTGFRFDQVGCWRLELRRTVGVGNAWVQVE